MSQTYRIRKGVDIRLEGEAQKSLQNLGRSDVFAIKPPDFHGVTPKMVVKQGEAVKAGQAIFIDKYNDKVQFVSPVSGTLAEVVRGAKRRILEVRINADASDTYQEFGALNLDSASREDVLSAMLDNGLWPFVKQRPFDIVADYTEKPKAIFVSGFDSAPLAPDADFVMQGMEEDFAQGMKALVKLADGKPVHLSKAEGSSFYGSYNGVTVNTFKGPHPAGNVGVQIHKISPVNKGEVVWTVNPQDVANIGRSLASGKCQFVRTFALTGARAENAQYYRGTLGSSVKALTGSAGVDVRVISGNVLTGEKIANDGFLGFYEQQVTMIGEGHEPQFFLTKGWLGPGFNKFSMSRTFPTWLMPKSKKWDLNTSLNGEERAFVMTGQYEKVFPFDIYPVQLIKSVIVNDIDSMEKLGIYEVAPEDFALCEYVCTSKIDVQDIIREGLDTIKREC